MKTKLKKISDSRIELTVTLEAEDLKTAKEKALSKLAKEIKVEGFRKGKVPVEIAKKFIPENDLNAETIDFAVRSTVIPAFQEVEKSPLVLPNVNVTKYVPDETAEYTATADIVPEVKLCDYKKLGVKKPEIKVLEKEINDIIENIRTSFAEKKVAKKAAEEGDEVIIDFVGKKDGKAFQGGSAKDYKLTLGSKTFIPGFEEGIIGHESGDKFDLKLTFPKDYVVKDLACAKTVFEVLVKQVNEIIKPELNDELAEKCGGLKSVKELKEDIKKNLEAQKRHQVEEKFKDDLLRELVKKSKIPAPEVLIDDQMRVIRDDMTRNASSQGLSLEEFLKRNNETVENWEKEARKVAGERVKASLALQNVAISEKIKVSDDLVAAKIAELRDVYKKSPEALKQLKDPNVKTDIRNRLTIEATLDYLVKENSK